MKIIITTMLTSTFLVAGGEAYKRFQEKLDNRSYYEKTSQEKANDYNEKMNKKREYELKKEEEKRREEYESQYEDIEKIETKYEYLDTSKVFIGRITAKGKTIESDIEIRINHDRNSILIPLSDFDYVRENHINKIKLECFQIKNYDGYDYYYDCTIEKIED